MLNWEGEKIIRYCGFPPVNTQGGTLMADNSCLFSGNRQSPGGLSNESGLIGMCPPEFFKSDNEWVKYAKALNDTHNTMYWKWKAPDNESRNRQCECLKGIISSTVLVEDKKLTIAAWMLSEMLEKVPAPPEPKDGDEITK